MDTSFEKLALVLKLATSSNSLEVKEAEKLIEESKEYPLYLTNLIRITTGEYSDGVKLLAAIQFKNFVETYWKFGKNEQENKALVISEKDRIIVISEEEKSLLRSQIIRLTGEFSNKSIMKLFVEAIRKIFKLDFVKCWQKESISEIISLLDSQSESKIYCGLTIFYQLSKLYEFESVKNRIEYDLAFENMLPRISEIFKNVNNKLDNEVGLVILKKILKIIYKTIHSDIPQVLAVKQTFEFYIQTILAVVTNLEGADKLKEQSCEELLMTNYWKVGLLCFQIPFRLISKYSNPNVTDSKKLKELSVNLNKNYQPEILKVFFLVLEKTLQVKFPDKIICIIYKYLTHLINKNSFVDLIVPHLNILLSEFIVQNSVISKSDILLRIDDEKSYIYKVFDVAQSFHDKRYACSSFIRALCEYREFNPKTKKLGKPEFLEKIFEFLVSMFDKYLSEKSVGKTPDPLIKEALMHLFETIAVPVMDNKSPSEIEKVIKSFIIPELLNETNPNFKGVGLIKEKAIFVIKFYSSLKYTDMSTLRTIVELLCQNLQDVELSVRVVTSVTLPSLMKHVEVKSFLEQYIKNLLQEYLKLMNQIDMEELLVGLENIIEHFGDKVTEYAFDLTKELVNQFNRLINISQEEDTGESHLAAEGVIKAINRIISICCSSPELISQVEALIKPVVDYSLSGVGFEYLDEGLDIIKTLVSKTSTVSKTTWSYFILINYSIIGDEEENIKIIQEFPDTGLEGIGYDSLEELLGVLAEYVSKDVKTLVREADQTGKLFIDRLFQTTEQIIKNSVGVLDVSNNVTSCRMFCQVLDACTVYNIGSTDPLNIDLYVVRILEFLVTTILKTKTLTYKIGLYDTLCSCLVYNSKLTLDFLFNKGKLEQVMLKWFDFVESLKTEKNMNKNIYGLTSCLMQAASFKTNYNLDPTGFISILSKNIFNLIVKLNTKKEKKLTKSGGIIDLEDSDDEVDMDKDFEAKLKKAKQNMENEEDIDDDEILDDIDQVDYMLSEEWNSHIDTQNSITYFADFFVKTKHLDPAFFGLISKDLSEKDALDLDSILGKNLKK